MESPTDTLVFLAAAVLLSVERVGYAWIWRDPVAFQGFWVRKRFAASRDPVDGVEAFFLFSKVLQASVFAGWCAYFAAGTGGPASPIAPAGALGVVLVVIGQALNASVFGALGRVGVFYGNRFGRETPWCERFPFSVLDHPQYVGAVLSIWGLFLLARYPHDDWVVLPLIETAYYVLGAWYERVPARGATAERS